MVIAIDIFSDSVKKTKELFFPIRKGYWVRMAFLSAFTGRASGSLGNGLGSGNGDSGIGFKESIASFNAEALSFFAKYGTILGVFLGMLVAIGTAISFISSVLTFSFIEGIDKQEIRLRKSWKTHQGDGLSLFFVRWVFGLLSLLVFLAIFYPVIAAFLSNTLSAFNWWLLIPMVLGLILISFPIGIALFILECFVVPIMYYKKKGIHSAWSHFKSLAKGNMTEIFLFWLISGCLEIVRAVCGVILFLPFFLIAVFLILAGIIPYLLLKDTFPPTFFIIMAVASGAFMGVVFTLAYLLVSAPLSAFPVVYMLEMVKRLESSRTKTTQATEA